MRNVSRALLCCGALSLVAATAHAQDSERKAVAETLFEQARSLTSQGKFGEACPKFAESQRLDPALGTMLWLADCYENNGQVASAWAQFREAAGVAAMRHDAREAVALEHVKALEPKLSKLKVIAKPTSGLEVKRNGTVMGAAELGLELPIDPGEHVFVASAPGKKPWSTRLKVEKPGVSNVEIPELEAAPADRTPPVTPPPAPEPPRPASEGGWGTQRTIGLVVGGVGIVALGVGTAIALGAKSTYDASNANGHCLPDNHCDATGLANRSDAKSGATLATFVLIGGAAATGAGAVLFFTAKKSTTIAPQMSASGAGVLVRHTW